MKMVLFVIILASVLGCGAAPYPKCSETRTFRCNGDVIESCNGSFWNPIRDCSKTGHACVDAECVEVLDE
jgi:hypothetical protein